MSSWGKAKVLLEAGNKFKVGIDTDYDIDFSPLQNRNDTLMDDILSLWDQHSEEIKSLLDKVSVLIQSGKGRGGRGKLGEIEWDIYSEFQDAMAKIRYMMSLPPEPGDRVPDYWRNQLGGGGGLGQAAVPAAQRKKLWVPLKDRDNDPLDQNTEFGRDED